MNRTLGRERVGPEAIGCAEAVSLRCGHSRAKHAFVPACRVRLFPPVSSHPASDVPWSSYSARWGWRITATGATLKRPVQRMALVEPVFGSGLFIGGLEPRASTNHETAFARSCRLPRRSARSWTSSCIVAAFQVGSSRRCSGVSSGVSAGASSSGYNYDGSQGPIERPPHLRSGAGCLDGAEE